MRGKYLIVLGIATIILLATFNSVVGTSNKNSTTQTATPLYTVRISNALDRKEISNTNYIKKHDENDIALPKLQSSMLARFNNIIKNNENFRKIFRNIIKNGRLNMQMMQEIIKKLDKGANNADMLLKLNSRILGKTSPNWTPLTFLMCWYIYIWVALFVTAMWSCFAIC